MLKNIIVFGGAGFIGSNITKKLVELGYNTIVVDGLLPNTGGDLKNLKDILDKIKFYSQRIEEIPNLEELIKASDFIIDSMAWTLHLGALANPHYDLELNCISHLYLIQALSEKNKVIYLGSRGQYGNPLGTRIDETTPMIPLDVQGIHKLSAENYYRIYSKIKDFDVVSLRIANCFGENQQIKTNEAGLIASFFIDALKGKTIKVYGKERIRPIVYVDDLVSYVIKIMNADFIGFDYFNLNGYDIPIYELAKIIVDHVGTGDVTLKDIPQHIADIDIGNVRFDDSKLVQTFPDVSKTDLGEAIKKTTEYFRENLN